MLADHLRLLAGRVGALSITDAPYIEKATMALVAACVAPCSDLCAAAAPQMGEVLFQRARRYVEAHFGDAELSPQRMCRELGVSRATLYRMFEARDGVAAYIQARRLARVHRLLSDSRDGRGIAEIAYEHGFASAAHFTRAFRRAFDATPSEVRSGRARMNGAVGGDSIQRYHAWVQNGVA